MSLCLNYKFDRMKNKDGETERVKERRVLRKVPQLKQLHLKGMKKKPNWWNKQKNLHIIDEI